MRIIRKLVKFIFDVINGVIKDNIGAYSAHAAFFVTISFIPFIMLLIGAIGFLPFTQEEVIAEVIVIFPQAAQNFVSAFINEAYGKADATLISITAISTLWAASIGVFAVTRGMNKVFCTEETRNYFAVRFASVIYTLFILLLLVSCLLLFVFGGFLYETVLQLLPKMLVPALVVMSLRTIFSVIIMSLVFASLFTIIPNRKTKFLLQLPGACVSALGWIGFSHLFSYYYENMANYSYLYGSLSILVFFMLWLFVCIYILFIGAEINKSIEDRVAYIHFMK